MSNYSSFDSKIEKITEKLSYSFSTIRAGRASPSVLDRIAVDYYGTPTPIGQIASISTPEPRILAIGPWDASALRSIEKAIQASDIGINPTNDGKVIRLVFPQLTEERRKELTKQTHKYAEEAKVAVRHVRRELIEEYKGQKKRSEITEDDLKDIEKELQELTDKAIREIDLIAEKKNKELMEV
ncbi:MAG: ribosome recycling factor [Oscillospiraceae bacterium]|nr:ribosome recycling factor [Oscillospiraceae bacterium]